MSKTISFASLSVTLALTFAINNAQAAPIDDARVHFQAIAAGNISAVMESYAERPQFQWVGGPLDGAYGDTESIRSVWSKFISSQASPMKLNVSAIEQSVNPKGATVSANVLFEGKTPIKVRYVLTFREGKIVNEVWQIDPNLSITSAY